MCPMAQIGQNFRSMILLKEIGNCPDCGKQLRRIYHAPGKPKGRYKCMNIHCKNVRWMNRYGEDRPGGS